MDDFEQKVPTEPEEPEEVLPAQDAAQPEPYTPRPLGVRIFAWVLAILVIVGLALYYYNIMFAK